MQLMKKTSIYENKKEEIMYLEKLSCKTFSTTNYTIFLNQLTKII